MALEKQTVQTVRLRDRVGLMAIGHTAKQIEEFLFDTLLYGTVVGYLTTAFGPIWGSLASFVVMAPLSTLVCLVYIKLYDMLGKDMFGFEAAKSLKEEVNNAGFWAGLVRKMLRLGDVPAFIALSIHTDPFMTTIYLRKGSDQYDGMSKRDWYVFFGSVLFSNGYWTLRWTVIVLVAVWVWNFVPEPVQSTLLASWNWVTALFS